MKIFTFSVYQRQRILYHGSIDRSRDEHDSNPNFLLVQLQFQIKQGRYAATEVACGWAGAMFEVTKPFGHEQWGQRNKIIKKVKRDRPTDQTTNQPTDKQTDKAGCGVACTRPKRIRNEIVIRDLECQNEIYRSCNVRRDNENDTLNKCKTQ